MMLCPPILHTLQKHHGETHTQTALLYSAASLLLPPAGNNLKSICFWCWIRQHVTFNRLQFLALQRTWKCHTLVVVSWCWGASGYWCFLSPRCACERCPGQTYIVIFLPAFLTQEVSQPMGLRLISMRGEMFLDLSSNNSLSLCNSELLRACFDRVLYF